MDFYSAFAKYQFREQKRVYCKFPSCFAEVSEGFWDTLVQEASVLPRWQDDMLEKIVSWWDGSEQDRHSWEEDLRLDAKDHWHRGEAPPITHQVLTNCLHADLGVSSRLSDPFFCAFCFGDQLGRTHYADAVCSGSIVNGGAVLKARYSFKQIVKQSGRLKHALH